jgi:hypothetical protein
MYVQMRRADHLYSYGKQCADHWLNTRLSSLDVIHP